MFWTKGPEFESCVAGLLNFLLIDLKKSFDFFLVGLASFFEPICY